MSATDRFKFWGAAEQSLPAPPHMLRLMQMPFTMEPVVCTAVKSHLILMCQHDQLHLPIDPAYCKTWHRHDSGMDLLLRADCARLLQRDPQLVSHA